VFLDHDFQSRLRHGVSILISWRPKCRNARHGTRFVHVRKVFYTPLILKENFSCVLPLFRDFEPAAERIPQTVCGLPRPTESGGYFTALLPHGRGGGQGFGAP